MKHIVNEEFLRKAEALKPQLIEKVYEPQAMVQIKDGKVIEAFPISELAEQQLAKGDQVCLDFGNHYVGYLTLHIHSEGEHPDAPLFMKLKF